MVANDNRPNANRRGYDAKWQTFSNNYRKRNPLCVECIKHGVLRPATQVHHIKPLKQGGKKYDTDNLMAVCRACHRRLDAKMA